MDRELGSGKRLLTPSAQSRRLGRRFPGKPYYRMIFSPDCPDVVRSRVFKPAVLTAATAAGVAGASYGYPEEGGAPGIR